MPEDDPRNPGTIADNVGDNVGDVAGMGADLFESFVGSIIAAATLGGTMYGGDGIAAPFYMSAGGIACSIIGCFCVQTKELPPTPEDDPDFDAKEKERAVSRMHFSIKFASFFSLLLITPDFFSLPLCLVVVSNPRKLALRYPWRYYHCRSLELWCCCCDCVCPWTWLANLLVLLDWFDCRYSDWKLH